MFAGRSAAGPSDVEPRAASPTVPLEQLLRPDGSLDLHAYSGSVSATGWRVYFLRAIDGYGKVLASQSVVRLK